MGWTLPTRTATSAVAVVMGVLLVVAGTACAPPGGPGAELIEAARSARSSVLIVRSGLVDWQNGRLPRPTARVVIDDATALFLDDLGTVVALDARSAEDETLRRQVLPSFGDAQAAIVAARTAVSVGRDDPRIHQAVAALDHAASGLEVAEPTTEASG